MARPVQVELYRPPDGMSPPDGDALGFGPSLPYTTESDWINPDAVIDLRPPRFPPPAEARIEAYRGQYGRRRTRTQYQGAVDCTIVHLPKHDPALSTYHPTTNTSHYPRTSHMLVGTVVDVVDLLWPPTVPIVTGVSLVVSAGTVEVRGLRVGSQTHFMAGEIINLDAKLLRGAYWEIAPLASGTAATFKVTADPNFTMQVRGTDGTWTDVTNNTALTARNLFRVKPAAE